MNGIWETDDLLELLTILALNLEGKLDAFKYGRSLFSFIVSIKTLLKRNTLKNSKKNVHDHYDLGNDFYSLWLDPGMTYSSALFKKGTESLFEAQKNKYHRILTHLNHTGDSVLDIGCGWGAFAEYAALNGKQVKAITISHAQSEYAKRRIAKKHLDADIVVQDYRLENKKFDNIVSIGMFEHVGKEYWNVYFRKIQSCLNKNGHAMIQTITINENALDKHTKRPSFINKHIFTGGFLPTQTAFETLAAKNHLGIIDKFTFGDSYARTLEIWLDNFYRAENMVRQLGFDQRFIKKWQFYLASCAAAFRCKRIDVVQYCCKAS